MFDTGNVGFMLLASSLVMLMTPGLAFFYGGLVGRKNVLAIMMQSFVSMGWTTVLWYLRSILQTSRDISSAAATGKAIPTGSRAVLRQCCGVALESIEHVYPLDPKRGRPLLWELHIARADPVDYRRFQSRTIHVCGSFSAPWKWIRSRLSGIHQCRSAGIRGGTFTRRTLTRVANRDCPGVGGRTICRFAFMESSAIREEPVRNGGHCRRKRLAACRH